MDIVETVDDHSLSVDTLPHRIFLLVMPAAFSHLSVADDDKRVATDGSILNSAHPAVFASAISKYVMKVGGLTIHPELIIDASNLLPPRPGGWNTMSRKDGDRCGDTTPSTDAVDTGDTWSWKQIEEEKAKGLKDAESFATLDDLHGEFAGENEMV